MLYDSPSCFASITVTLTAVSTRVKPGKDWSSSLGGPLPNGSTRETSFNVDQHR